MSPPPLPAVSAAAEEVEKTPTPTSSSNEEMKHHAPSPKRQAPESASAETPPQPHKKRRESSEHRTPEAAPAAERSGGKRQTRRSFGSDGSGALGGSERSASSRSQSLPSDDFVDDALLYHRSLGDPDVILHVDSCSFAVHSDVVQRLGPGLRRQLLAACSEPEPRGEITRFSAVLNRRTDAFGRPSPEIPPFSLRRVDRARNRLTAHGSEMALSSSPARCPLDAARVTGGEPAGGERRRNPSTTPTPFTTARCLAHSSSRTSVASETSTSGSSPGQRSDTRASPRQTLRGIRGAGADSTRLELSDRPSLGARSTGDPAENAAIARQSSLGRVTGSEGKENRALNSQEAASRRLRSQHELLAELEREQQTISQDIRSQQFDSHEMGSSSRIREGDVGPLPRRIDPRSSAAPAIEKVHIEWCQTHPAAIATVLEFAYTDEFRLVDPTTAYDVVQLCQWMKAPSCLLHASLAVVIEHVLPEQWVPLCTTCWKLSDETVRNALMEKLFDFLRTLPQSRRREILAKTHIELLAVITDADLLGRIVMCFVNHVVHVGVWRNLLFMMDIWGKRVFGRGCHEPPLSLVELHRQFAPWDPFISLPRAKISGENYTVRPKTLFQFGEFSLQVRFEMDSLVLIQWRIVKESESDPYEDMGVRRSDPKFVLRGEMKVEYQCVRGGDKQEQIVSLRYNHSVHEYGVWNPLVKASSAAARVIDPLELRAARAVEGLPSQSETEASQQASQAGREEVPEFMRATFTGRFFAWGHRLCNLYHFLTGYSMFYHPRSDAVGELLQQTSLEKMRSAPLDTLVLSLQSDRLRIRGGETALVVFLTKLCFKPDIALEYARSVGDAGDRTDFSEVPIVRTLFRCVRWCYVDEAQILATLKLADRKYLLYELVHDGLKDPVQRFPRRTPFKEVENPYRECTSLVEFELNAGDDGLSPSQFSQEHQGLPAPSSEEL